MASQKSALAAARRRWGKTAYVREQKRALTKAQREQRQAHVRSLRQRIVEIDNALRGTDGSGLNLLTKAEFFLAVNGDEPSGTEFRAAVAECRRLQDLRDERSGLKEEQERLRSGCHSYRWEAGYIGGIGGGEFQYVAVQESADSLDELLAKIERRKEPDTARTMTMGSMT